MSAVSGWYPDPSGSPDLRFWDGQAWTSHVRSAPAQDSAQASAPAQADALRVMAGVGAATESASYFGSAMPSGRVDEDWTSSGMRPLPPTSHRRLITGLALAAVAVAVGIAVPVALSKSGSVYDRTSIVMPKTAAGYKQVVETSSKVSAAVAQAVPFSGARIGVYAEPGGDAGVILAVAHVKTAPSGFASALATAAGYAHDDEGHPADLSNFIEVTPGPLGGQMKCGTFQSDEVPVAGCIFVDQGAVGMLIVANASVVDPALMLQLRSSVEKRG